MSFKFQEQKCLFLVVYDKCSENKIMNTYRDYKKCE